MYEVIEELIREERIPRFAKLQYQIPAHCLEDVEGALRQALQAGGLLERIAPGDRVAVTAGSRQISNIVTILQTLVGLVRSRGAQPYIVAAMGSHGGATDAGQRAILTGYGITEEAMGCPIVSSMETECVGQSEHGLPVHMDRFAAHCDKIVVVNRVKIHTDFHGPVESGLAKMLAIGLGKQHGANICHQLGFLQMSENVTQFARIMLREKPVAFGVAIVEDAFHHTAGIYGVPAEEFETREPQILNEARRLMPRIPFDPIDVLVVDQIGKNISGAGMDPNVTGRSPRLGVTWPHAQRMVVLDICDESHGAATGIGNADAITRRAFEKFDFDVTYANGFTSNDPESIRIPAVLPSERAALQFALGTLMGLRQGDPRIVWIRDTNSLNTLWVSEPLLEEARAHPQLTALGPALQLPFDPQGNRLLGMWEEPR